MRRETSYDDASRPDHPQEKANWLSIITFWYTIPLFKKGKIKDIDEEDLTKPLDEHKSAYLGQCLSILWAKEVERAKNERETPHLTKILFKYFLKDIILQGTFLSIMEFPIRLCQPIFLGLLLRYFNPENQHNKEPSHPPMYIARLWNFWEGNQTAIQQEEAYLYASGILFTNIVNVMVLHPCMMSIMHVGMKLRVGVCSLLYRKTLRLDAASLGGSTVGSVINIIANDVTRFDLALMYIHYIWIAPLQMILSLYFIYREMGISSVVGISVVIAFIPLQAWFGNLTSVFRLETALRTDERVRQMNEIIQAIQVIKMYTWEYAFAQLIHDLRKSEIHVIKQTSYIRGTIMSFIVFTTRLAIFVTIVSYVLRGKSITAENVFFITSHYQILRQTVTLYFPYAIAQIAEVNVSISRIQKFLLMPECKVGDPTPLYPNYEKKEDPFLDKEPRILISNAAAKIEDEVCLQNVSLELKKRQLTAVIGHVGSGKSSLLHLILGELQPCIGQVSVIGSISYAAQEPWLFAGTVRQNILLGREYERERYQQAVRACALARDFALLPFGDLTVVGDKGISLSGGQRARINLARAVYKRADIYLLDDPLSAVDALVGKHLFDKCISEFLHDKIVILVTHQLQFLNDVNHIVLMEDGVVEAQGSYHFLENSGLKFSEFLKKQLAVDPTTENITKVDNILKDIHIRSSASINIADIPTYEPREIAEMRTQGSVGCYVYDEYFRAGGNCCTIQAVVWLFIGSQVLASTGDFFLSEWINTEEIHRYGLGKNRHFPVWGDSTTGICIAVYSVFITLTIIVVLYRSFAYFTLCMRASVTLHDRMFNSIIKGSMKFFNTNTSGCILNRFSKDLGAVDELLPNAMIDCAQIMLNLVGAVAVVAIVNYFLLIPTALICVVFYILRKYYLHTSRGVKRLEGITKSPVFAHVNATIQGLFTIRSHGAELILTKEFDKYQDVHSSAWFMFIATSRAFGFWLDFICSLYIGSIAYSFLIFNNTGSRVGLAITQAIGLSGLFQWGMKQSAEIENQMTSVERILEFTKIEHEGDLESSLDKKPPPDWPSEGRIEFRDLVLKYNDDEPPVLKSLSLVVQPKEKIGIVGRTGAGKSSMIAALFRLSPFEGDLIIDDIKIKELGLHDLRSKISIIPQEPVLFSGTLRYNMDPFNQYNDNDIVKSLVIVEVKIAITEGLGCLEHHVSEGGINISVGERQMICMARAILRNNIILVLDEATANVDSETDEFIQTTIRQKFAHCTVLTIAHRLHTIMDCDRVLVMDAGEAVEFDHPHILLQDPGGYLTPMVEKTGKAMAQYLKNTAKESYESKHGTPSRD